ncbi:meiosis initiator protein [Ochotona curzoniae]|uniref:meiosis initiator protein n=1 Tax=Ochotona curzoniae TaxID=130825 RepID=UPI001B353ACD|nr:meiosis initiator protein [Ochotona curzoniae]
MHTKPSASPYTCEPRPSRAAATRFRSLRPTSPEPLLLPPPPGALTISPRSSFLGYAGFPHSLRSNLPFRVLGSLGPLGIGVRATADYNSQWATRARSGGCLLCECVNTIQFLFSPNRSKTKNHSSKLQELALLLPVPLQSGPKKLTKKEILLHVLQYIQYLHRHIDATRALLRPHTTDAGNGAGGRARNSALGPARQRHATPSSSPLSHKHSLWDICPKPRKKKLTRGPEPQISERNPRRCLSLEKPEELLALPLEQPGGSASPLRHVEPCDLLKVAWGDGEASQDLLTLLDPAEDVACFDLPPGDYANPDQSVLTLEPQEGAEGIHFLNQTLFCPWGYETPPSYRQELMLFDPSWDVDQEAPDADPWLPAWSPEHTPHGSPLALEPPQVDSWSVLSPSLLSSPNSLLPEQILEESMEDLSQALFEHVFLGPELSSPSTPAVAPPQDEPRETLQELPEPSSPGSASQALDHGEDSCSSELTDTDWDSELSQTAESTWADPAGSPRSSDEDRDRTWTPSPAPPTKKKTVSPARPKEAKKAAGAAAPKKKCVNGFIMFCRMNRKQYIRACPGTASTAATKELAQLWRDMTLQERKPYCTKARRFSRQHNRIVKRGSSSSDEDWETPKPFYQLLAERALPLPPQTLKIQ